MYSKGTLPHCTDLSFAVLLQFVTHVFLWNNLRELKLLQLFYVFYNAILSDVAYVTTDIVQSSFQYEKKGLKHTWHNPLRSPRMFQKTSLVSKTPPTTEILHQVKCILKIIPSPPSPESLATLPPFSPIDQISSQWESQKNRFALIYFGKIQFLPPCIWNLPFMSTASVFTDLHTANILQQKLLYWFLGVPYHAGTVCTLCTGLYTK